LRVLDIVEQPPRKLVKGKEDSTTLYTTHFPEM